MDNKLRGEWKINYIVTEEMYCGTSSFSFILVIFKILEHILYMEVGKSKRCHT